MLFAIVILLAGLLVPSIIEARSIPLPPSRSNERIKRTVAPLKASREALDMMPISSNVLTLKSKKPSSSKRRHGAAHVFGHIPISNHSTPLNALLQGAEFATDITFGDQTFEAIVDTGSSDTWVAESGYACLDIITGEPGPTSNCAFGPTYTIDDTFSMIPNVNFNITYGDGSFLTGDFGIEEVTLGGITVNQQIAIVTHAGWQGDNTTSGLIGLAYPAMYDMSFLRLNVHFIIPHDFCNPQEVLSLNFRSTDQYVGTDPTVDNTGTAPQIPYCPLFQTMVEQGLISDLFSLVILRNSEGPAGYLSLGGLPPIDLYRDFASTPILVTHITKYPVAYDFYTINTKGVYLDGIVQPGSGGNVQYIVSKPKHGVPISNILSCIGLTEAPANHFSGRFWDHVGLPPLPGQLRHKRSL